MPSHNRTVWDNETINNNPPAVKTVKLEYPGVLDKVELSFKFDVSNFVGCILDENKPIEINGERVPLSLPSDRNKLKLVEMSGVDVTKYTKASEAGELNTIVVNYLVRGKPWFFGRFGKKNVGKLRLLFTIHWSAKDEPGPQPPPITQKYCMWHGEPVDPYALFCPFKGGEKFENTITPETTKICPNPSCKKRIHVREIFCEYCGIKQPGT
jgi:hypothetical protein